MGDNMKFSEITDFIRSKVSLKKMSYPAIIEKKSFYETSGAKFFDDAKIPSKIEYKPDAGVEDVLCFRYYNKDEVINGRKMRDWLRFSVVYWHTFRGNGSDPFGEGTIQRPWCDGTDSMANATRRLDVAFEFFTRLGVDYYTFHDRDVAPEGATLAESNEKLVTITDRMAKLQEKTGVKLLWATSNLFANARYMNGAATNPNVHVFAYAGAQVKSGMLAALKLGAQNYIFWGGREGFASLFNTNIRVELDNMAHFFRMVVAFKKEIGFTGQLCIEPKPKEPTKHQYDYDAMTVIAFLRTYALENEFKVNIEPNHTMLAGHDYLHDICMASAYGMLGSIDANAGSADLGWDTDQFPMDVRQCTWLMKVVMEQGGIAPGGLNFDCKVRRESTNIADLFVAHIAAMDTLARGLRIAAKMINDGVTSRMLKERYLSFTNTELGKKVTADTATLHDCEAYVTEHGEPRVISGRQEQYEAIINQYL